MNYRIQLLVILGVAVSVMSLHPLQTKEFEDAKKACKKELKITPQSPNKCFAQCVFKKMKMLDDQGRLTENIPEYLQNYTRSCAATNKIDSTCEAAKTLVKCIVKETTSHMNNVSTECAAETKTQVEFEEDNFENILPNLYNNAMACYYRCVMINFKILTENNEVDLKVVERYKVIDNFNLEEAVKTCNTDNQQTDKCLQAIHRARCVGDKYRLVCWTNVSPGKSCQRAFR